MASTAAPHVTLASFFQCLESFDYERGRDIAQQLPVPRRLQMALAHACTCETFYHSMTSLHHPTALERRLESTARELEFFLSSLPARTTSIGWSGSDSGAIDVLDASSPPQIRSDVVAAPHLSKNSLSAAGDPPQRRPPNDLERFFASVFGAVITCRSPAEWPSAMAEGQAPSVDARPLPQEGEPQQQQQQQQPQRRQQQQQQQLTGGGGNTRDSALIASDRDALSDVVELLRLRKAMLPVYGELISSSHSASASHELRVQRLADLVTHLRSSRASTLRAPLIEGIRELTLLELAALAPLLRAHALLPHAQLRDALVALTVARHELQKLRLRATGTLPENTTGFNLPFVGNVGQRNAPSATPEPNLHLFLRTLCVRLTDKALLFLHRPLGSFIAQDGDEQAPVQASDGGASNGAAAEGTETDLDKLVASVMAKHSGTALAAVLLDETGLHLSSPPGKGFVYSRNANEAPVVAAGYAPDSMIAGAPTSVTAAETPPVASQKPWPALYLAPHGSNSETLLRTLWPTVASLLRERRSQNKSLPSVHAFTASIAELDGTEYTFWLLPLDRRVLALVACAGGNKRLANDATITELLHTLAARFAPGKLVEGSLPEHQRPTTSWWGGLLRSNWSRGV